MIPSGQVFVVVPALNEAATIRPLVEGILSHVSHVILVDDGSEDGTADQLEGLSVTLLRHEARRGKAAALVTGMRQALERNAAAVITMDGDGQHRPDDLPAFLGLFAEAPEKILVGARDTGVENSPPLRLFANRFANFWISWASGYPIKDSQCGYRLYPRPVLELVQEKYGPAGGFVFESEILIDAARAGHRSLPVSIPALYGGVVQRRSHFRPAADIWQITRMVAGKLLSRGMYLNGLAVMTWEWLRGPKQESAPVDQRALDTLEENKPGNRPS